MTERHESIAPVGDRSEREKGEWCGAGFGLPAGGSYFLGGEELSAGDGWRGSVEGEEDEIDRSLAWAESKGLRVDPVTGDVVEG